MYYRPRSSEHPRGYTAGKGNSVWRVIHAEASMSEEPGAGKLHAGICAGGVG